MKKMLITGGTGFVGKHLREELQRQRVGYAVFGRAECDLTRLEQADAMFHRHADANVIVHLAGMQAAGEFSAKHAALLLDVNARIHLNVLASWQKWLPGAKFIGVGSPRMYPANAGSLKEDMVRAGDIPASAYGQGSEKRLLLNGIRAYNQQHKQHGTLVIPATMFGEQDDFHLATAQVTGALIGKFVRAMVENLPTVEVWGDGTQVREVMDVKDFVAALLQIIPRCERDVVNIGPGKGVSVRALAEVIKDASGFKGEVVYKLEGHVGVRERVLDVTKLNATYGCAVTGDLAAGVARTVSWYRSNFGQLRDRKKFG